ncbi:MAG: LLM class flavin-dependent oxidoreductase, partial [Gammaproteobacteria bacterium]|nr:LLM class flavin-dependent oxidoreductase [Gammaproteobacteria bacterium]
ADEALELLTRLWAERDVDFAGEHIRVSGLTIEPRPVQQPLPLWIGGDSEAAIRRTARLG